MVTRKKAKKTPAKRRRFRRTSKFPINEVATHLDSVTQQWLNQTISQINEVDGKPHPYRVLIGTILSLRTRDEQTIPAAQRLFEVADSPSEMLKIPEKKIAKLIYPVGFYNTKAKTIHQISEILIEKFNGKVPSDIDDLCTLPGVGRKTANLTITLGFHLPGICVDTHVHRICNRWGYIKTSTPDETEDQLRILLPQEYWIPINEWLVLYGQNVCTPQSPKCSICGLADHCAKKEVKKSR
jgi:endonuclease-3